MKKKVKKDIYDGKILGNQTTVNPREHVQSQYETYAVTQVSETINNVPIPPEFDVIRAKHFVDDNHK